MNPIGIMQGRLLPPVNGRIQAFPAAAWREELRRVKAAGLAGLEWVYESKTERANPLSTLQGASEVGSVAEREGVRVLSVCADYYMVRQITHEDGRPDDAVVEHLRSLLPRIRMSGARHVVLPFVDESSLRTPARVEGTVTALARLTDDISRHGVEVHLETDLPPETVTQMLVALGHPMCRANYDIGNSAALGRDPNDELRVLAPWIGSVHVKDRLLGGGSVPLGTGAARFPECVKRLREARYEGPLILQAAREAGISELDLARRNCQFVADLWNAPAEV